jgi:NADPH:quinone reductase-like Zn-dependent oxidoreductase
MKSMKAIIYTKFGKPEVLRLVSIDKPVPKENEVLIRIYATTVEKEDPGMRKSPGINGIFKPKRQILGMEFAGKIEAIGSKVTKFKIGDEVFGNTGMGLGAYAEYKCLIGRWRIGFKAQQYEL